MEIFFARSSLARIIALAPSETGAQSRTLSGSAMYGEDITSPTEMSIASWAMGFFLALAWFFTDTCANCSSVTENLSM